MPEHICTEKETLGSLKEAVNNLNQSVIRLDLRCNGTFDKIDKHITESDGYRQRIILNEKCLKDIKEEKLNTTKNSQWRIALIVGTFISATNLIIRVFLR